MDLDKDPSVPGRVPEKADRVEGGGFLLHVSHPVAQGRVDLKNPLVGMSSRIIDLQ